LGRSSLATLDESLQLQGKDVPAAQSEVAESVRQPRGDPSDADSVMTTRSSTSSRGCSAATTVVESVIVSEPIPIEW